MLQVVTQTSAAPSHGGAVLFKPFGQSKEAAASKGPHLHWRRRAERLQQKGGLRSTWDEAILEIETRLQVET